MQGLKHNLLNGFFIPAAVRSMKFVPMLGDVRVVTDSVLSQYVVFCVSGLTEESTDRHTEDFFACVS